METEQSKEQSKEQLAVEAFAKDIEEVNKKHNMRIVPRSMLEVEYIEKPKPVMEVV
jgi:hypothetical protein